MRKPLLVSGMFLLAAGAIATLGLLDGFPLRKGPALGDLMPGAVRLAADPTDGQVSTTFIVKNIGGEPLIINDVSPKCGCTVASIQRSRLRPGETCSVVLKGTPPSAGEKRVIVDVNTNSPIRETLQFTFTMIGSQVPPFVTFTSGPVRFGTIDGDPPQEQVILETRERLDSTPWIEMATTRMDGLDIEGGLAKETPLKGGLVQRRYEFVASLTKIPPPGTSFSGTIRFSSHGSTSVQSTEIEVSGNTPPSIEVFPSTLYSSFFGDELPPKLRLIIAVNGKQGNRRVEPDPSSLERFHISRIGIKANKNIFEVTPRKLHREALKDSLTFHVDGNEIVTVPISLKWKP